MALSLDKDLKFACECQRQRATGWELLWKERYENSEGSHRCVWLIYII